MLANEIKKILLSISKNGFIASEHKFVKKMSRLIGKTYRRVIELEKK